MKPSFIFQVFQPNFYLSLVTSLSLFNGFTILTDTPWGTLPILEVDGQVIAQSQTISRFVAKLTGIHGDDIYEQAKYDAIVDACQDLVEAGMLWELEEDDKIKVCISYFHLHLVSLRNTYKV